MTDTTQVRQHDGRTDVYAKPLTFEQKSQKTILVVDDERTVLESVVKILQLDGYNCHGANTSSAALNICKSIVMEEGGKIDAVVIDLNLGNSINDGFKLMKKIYEIGVQTMFYVVTGSEPVDVLPEIEKIQEENPGLLILGIQQKPLASSIFKYNIMNAIRSVSWMEGDALDGMLKIPKRDLYERVFFDQLSSWVRQYRRSLKDPDFKKVHQGSISLLIFDIDNFKNFNTLYGYEGGNKVLKSVSQFIAENKRSEDFFARWGGEEFILLMDEATSSQAERAFNRLSFNFANEVFELENTETGNIEKTSITFSCGIATISFNIVDKLEYLQKLNISESSQKDKADQIINQLSIFMFSAANWALQQVKNTKQNAQIFGGHCYPYNAMEKWSPNQK